MAYSIESFGLGQSGYTAGRREGDLALEEIIEARNQSYPRNYDDVSGFGLDDRWTGRGGSRWCDETSNDDSH